jgi:heme a synthase
LRLPLKSPSVAAWLFVAAFLIFSLVAVGGATRLTQSGLSITEWKPISGIIPPMSDDAWTAEFENYKKIPQYSQINAHMSVDDFKGIYWWEWAHRVLARLLGFVYLLPFVWFLIRKEMPKRIIWRSAVAIGMILFQGAVGWWMVASGLTKRVFVAPEMLMAHLSMALILFMWTIWTGLEAGAGENRSRGAPLPWKIAGFALLGVVFLQCMLGALVAGNHAGLLYNDWPLMNGWFMPYVDWSRGAYITLFHDQGWVQFIHRMNAYLLFLFAIGFAMLMGRKCQDDGLKTLAWGVAGAVTVQAVLGIATLWTVVNFWLALTHQLMAIIVLGLSVLLAWKVARADRVFRRGGF